MTADEIKKYLSELNDELELKSIKGEVSLFGGAVMVLAFDARIATKDIDAIFQPTQEIRAAVERIAERNNLNKDWLNDGVKGYVVDHTRKILFSMPNLNVFIPESDYLLAMKSLAARAGTEDENDVRILINITGLNSPDEIFAVIEKYYPKQLIPPRTQYFIEGLFEE
jgi:hypothetical protein